MTIAPRFLDAGEAALVVEYGLNVDPAIHDRVMALDASLAAKSVRGIRETVPTFRSLMIHYDPLVLDRASLVKIVESLDATPAPAARRLWTVPCCYDPAFGEDLGHIAEAKKLSVEKVVRLHAGATYRAYMYGFAPGFCYLGGAPGELTLSRRTTPRPPTLPQVIMIADGMSIITTISMPTGWWLVGRTPERFFSRNRDPAFLADAGDQIRFEPIDRATYDALDARAEAGEVVARSEKLP
ncbi:MAG: 5-oxoprolinase subunit B family protein [Alphaproteobacteria bacterium]